MTLATSTEPSQVATPTPEFPSTASASSALAVFLMTTSGDRGGTERQFAIMADALGKGSFHVETGCIHRRGSFFDGLPRIQEFSLGGSFVSWRALKSCAALWRHLRREKIAVAHSFDFYTNLMLLPIARLAGTPVVIGSMRQLGDRLTSWQTRVLSWVLRSFPDRIVCNSLAAAARLQQLDVPDKKLVVIPNALPEEVFQPTEPAFPRKNMSLRIGMVARMNEKVKNHPALLRAVAILIQEIPDIEVFLVGDGKLRADLEKMSSDLGITANIRFLGERQDIPAILAGLDISVLTSTSESSSNAILEAMAAGLPVVATRVGGTPELVQQGETGFLVDSGDDTQLVDALRTLLQNESLRRQFGLRGREFARTRFGVASIQRQYEDLYGAVLAVLKEKRATGRGERRQP